MNTTRTYAMPVATKAVLTALDTAIIRPCALDHDVTECSDECPARIPAGLTR